jgi:hypothetical protein
MCENGKLISADVDRLNGEVLQLLDEKEAIELSKQRVKDELEELKEKSEYESTLLQSLALRTQYQVAICRLKIRIAAWERDGRDQHIRFFICTYRHIYICLHMHIFYFVKSSLSFGS